MVVERIRWKVKSKCKLASVLWRITKVTSALMTQRHFIRQTPQRHKTVLKKEIGSSKDSVEELKNLIRIDWHKRLVDLWFFEWLEILQRKLLEN